MYQAAAEGRYVDPGKVEEILKVPNNQIETEAMLESGKRHAEPKVPEDKLEYEQNIRGSKGLDTIPKTMYKNTGKNQVSEIPENLLY